MSQIKSPHCHLSPISPQMYHIFSTPFKKEVQFTNSFHYIYWNKCWVCPAANINCQSIISWYHPGKSLTWCWSPSRGKPHQKPFSISLTLTLFSHFAASSEVSFDSHWTTVSRDLERQTMMYLAPLKPISWRSSLHLSTYVFPHTRIDSTGPGFSKANLILCNDKKLLDVLGGILETPVDYSNVYFWCWKLCSKWPLVPEFHWYWESGREKSGES